MVEAPLWLAPLIGWDYKIAVVLTVIMPLLLLGWAFWIRSQSLIQLLIRYWRISSLLAITVYLMIAGAPISFLTGLVARVLIPISLWFWPSTKPPISPIWTQQVFEGWRWSVTVYMSIGSIFSMGFIPCAFQDPFSSACRAWLQPPLRFRDIFHPNTSTEIFGIVGSIGLFVYGLYVFFTLWQLQQKSDIIRALDP
jgi:hypothetical protein